MFIMNTKDKIQEGQVLLDDKNNYTPLTTPMVIETARKTSDIIYDLHQGNHIDTMTKKWLLQTPNPPRIPVFLHIYKDSQTNFTWKTNNFGLWRSNRTYIIVSRPHPTAYRSNTKILPQGYHTVYQLYWKEESSKKCDSSFNGCQQLVHQYSSGRRNQHRMRSIRILL